MLQKHKTRVVHFLFACMLALGLTIPSNSFAACMGSHGSCGGSVNVSVQVGVQAGGHGPQVVRGRGAVRKGCKKAGCKKSRRHFAMSRCKGKRRC